MRYDNNDEIEIIDAFDELDKNVILDAKTNSSKRKSVPNVKKQSITKSQRKKNSNHPNYLFNFSIIILPISLFLYNVSLRSNVLINRRLSIFLLITSIISALSLIIGLFYEMRIARKISTRIFKTALASIYAAFFVFLGISLYGDNSTIRDFIINKAMSTTNHQYLAMWLFNHETISESLTQLKKATQVEIDGSHKFDFSDINFDNEFYTNPYEEAILKKNNPDDDYKIIKITGKTIGSKKTFKGYLVAVYDPSKVKLATSSGAGVDDSSYGEILSVIAKKSNAQVAMNAGGFYDPYWNSNGGIPHGAVIKNGQILTEFRRGMESGGLIGFTNDNKLILKRMTAQEAIDEGVRDAVDWGPYLIVDGKNQYKKVTYSTWATSRTAIGQRRDGIVLFLVIDGVQPDTYGASYADVAKVMEQYGAINAANLDGGTSTALVEKNQYINNPWNGHKRTIRRLPNAWIVTK